MSKVQSMEKKNVDREVWNRVQRISGHKQNVKQKGKSNESKSRLRFLKK